MEKFKVAEILRTGEKNRTAVSVPSKIASKKNWLSRLSSAEIPFVQVR